LNPDRSPLGLHLISSVVSESGIEPSSDTPLVAATTLPYFPLNATLRENPTRKSFTNYSALVSGSKQPLSPQWVKKAADLSGSSGIKLKFSMSDLQI
jgi:hypothetical protein